jgi:ferredoxin-NADP reductase
MQLTLPIRDVVPATPRARIVRLDLGRHVFPYAAGQAVMVAAHGDPQRRPYSISCAPEDAQRDRALELLVGTEPADGLDRRFMPVVGARVDVEGPVGTFTLLDSLEARRFLFVAGGTGIAPLRAMLRHALTRPHDSIGLFYSARTPDEFAYGDELRTLAREGRIALRQTITRSTVAHWADARGRVTREVLAELVHGPETLCFVCGPPALVTEVPGLLEELGIPGSQIRLEGRTKD